MTPKNQPANYETFNHTNHHLPPSLDFTSVSSVHENFHIIFLIRLLNLLCIYFENKVVDNDVII